LKHIRFLQNDDAFVAKKRLFGFFLSKAKNKRFQVFEKEQKKKKKISR
jgi:hypothetical protein